MLVDKLVKSFERKFGILKNVVYHSLKYYWLKVKKSDNM